MFRHSNHRFCAARRPSDTRLAKEHHQIVRFLCKNFRGSGVSMGLITPSNTLRKLVGNFRSVSEISAFRTVREGAHGNLSIVANANAHMGADLTVNSCNRRVRACDEATSKSPLQNQAPSHDDLGPSNICLDPGSY